MKLLGRPCRTLLVSIFGWKLGSFARFISFKWHRKKGEKYFLWMTFASCRLDAARERGRDACPYVQSILASALKFLMTLTGVTSSSISHWLIVQRDWQACNVAQLCNGRYSRISSLNYFRAILDDGSKNNIDEIKVNTKSVLSCSWAWIVNCNHNSFISSFAKKLCQFWITLLNNNFRIETQHQ